MSDKDSGRPGGLSSQATEPVPVSVLRASIPDADAFALLIRSTLAEHPKWLPDAIEALFAGSVAALERLNSQRAASDAACLAALALCDTKRLPPDLRAALLATITKPMHAPNLCALERKFVAQAIDARRAETAKTGSVEDESAVAEGDAPNPRSREEGN